MKSLICIIVCVDWSIVHDQVVALENIWMLVQFVHRVAQKIEVVPLLWG